MVQLVRRRRSQCDDLDYSDYDHSLGGKLFRRRSRLHGPPASSFQTCVQFLLLSSLVPVLFFLRFAREDLGSFLRYQLTLPATLPEPFAFLPDLLQMYGKELRHHHHPSSEFDEGKWLHSDLVELHHCQSIWTTPTFPWTNFTTWAEPWVNQTLQEFHLPVSQQGPAKREIILELLELYAVHSGYCDFSRYRPTLVHPSSKALEKTSLLPTLPGHARRAFVLTIHRSDPTHVQRLLREIHLPHHYIVLHLDRHAPDRWHSELLTIAKPYDNVEVIRFGTAEDSRSMMHLKIMRWLTMDLGLTFDYHITLDGASFPLLPAQAMAQQLFASPHWVVWLGTLTEQGNLPSQSQTNGLLNTRLTTTTGTPATATLGRIFQDTALLPDLLVQDNRLGMNHKTTSGSYAIFSQSLVQRLQSSPQALQIFALSKYGCCSTSLDSYLWMAALQLLRTADDNNSNNILPSNNNIVNQAKLHTAMFQLWGGTKDCDKAWREDVDADGAVLSMDPTKCYRIEHGSVVKAAHGESAHTNTTFFSPSDWAISKERLVLNGGGDVLNHIKSAVKVGFLFARQFDSSDQQSVALLDAIEHAWKADST